MSIRTKGILVALAVVAGVAAAGYAAAPWLVATIAVRALEGVVDVHELKINSVRLSRIEVAVVRASTPQASLDARRATVRFDPWPFRIRSVDIHESRLSVAGAPGGEDGGGTVALPPFPLRVEKLSLQVQTPWGELAFPASVESAPGTAGGLDASIRSPAFSVILRNPSENRHVLEVLDADETGLLSLTAHTGGELPAAFEGDLNPQRLARWLRESPVVPAGLRPALASYAFDSGTVAIRGSLEPNLDITAELRGGMTVRDTRESAERIFDTVELESQSGYTVARSGASWTGSGDASFRIAPNPDIALTGRDPGLRWNDDGLSFSASAMRLDPPGLEADTVDADASVIDASGAQGDLRAGGLRIEGWPVGLGYYDAAGSWSWRESSLEAGGTGSGAGLPDLGWELSTSGDTGRVAIDIRDSAAAIQASLAPYAAIVAPDLQILAGGLEGRYQMDWDAVRERTILELEAASVDADLGGMEIRGLDVRVRNMDDGIERLGVAVSAPTLQLAAGTVAEELEMTIRVSPPDLHLDTARTRLFNGRISLRPVSFRLDDDEIELVMDIDALSLESVMTLMELETTELTGEVSGPVRVILHSDSGVEINKGDLRSVRPGVLRFHPDPDSSMTAEVDNIALRALQDFQYDELNATVVYKPDGGYRISARILGRNPDVLDGHPIAFNPTIEGRLPALFRSFFITGDFNQAIIRRLQEEQGLSTPGESSTLEQ